MVPRPGPGRGLGYRLLRRLARHSGRVCRRGRSRRRAGRRTGMGWRRGAGSSSGRRPRRRSRMGRQRRAGCSGRGQPGSAARQRPGPRWRYRWTPMGAGNGQRVGLGQLGRWRGRWNGRWSRRWRTGRRDIGGRRRRRSWPRRRPHRRARRHRRLALLNQGGALHDRLRHGWTSRIGAPGNGRREIARSRSGTRTRRRGCRRLVDHRVDDRPIMDVLIDDVVRRGCDIDRRPDEHRNRHEHRLRQHEQADHRHRRRQHDEIRRRRRQIVDRRRRWRREAKIRIAEIQHGTVDIDHLLRRRWRHVVVDHREARRRLGRRGENRQAPARIRRMWTARIATQIRPIGFRCVGTIGPPPGDGLAARRDDHHHALRQRVAGIGGEKLFIGRQRVARERGGIGILHAEIADRLVADRGDLVGRGCRRRSIGPALEERELRRYLLLVPGHLRALAGLVDAQANAVEHLGQRQAAGADHLRQRLRIDAVRSGLLGRHRAGRCIERDQHVGVGLDQRKSARDLLAALHEGLRPRSVEHDDVGLERNGSQLAEIVADAQAFGRNVGVAGDVGIDRDEVVLARKLHAIAGEIDHRDGARA